MALTNGHTNGHTNSHTKDHKTTNTTTAPFTLPIVIAGGGCVGLFLALLLAHSPIPNRIIVIEPQHPDPSVTRAMAHQPLTYPILSRVPGLLPDLIRAGSLSSGLCFRTSVACGSRVIAGKRFGNGGSDGVEGMGEGKGGKGIGQLLLAQGKFQEVLLEKLRGFERKVDVRLGWRVSGFMTEKNLERDVFVKISKVGSGSTPNANDGEDKNDGRGSDQSTSSPSPSTPTMPPEEEEIKAAYLIGADGAHSLVRKTLGIEFEGETLDAQLVATDIRFDFHAHGFYDANFILDPEDYGLIGRISDPPSATTPSTTPTTPSSGTGRPDPTTIAPLWRVSYGVPATFSDSEIHTNVHDKLARMLPSSGLSPSGQKAYKIQRIAPYKPQQRLVSTLYKSRAVLIGDAAHLTNPYAGLGLASGIADAASLSDLLVQILTGQARDPERLLNAWSEARRKVFTQIVDGPSRMAYKRVRSDVSSEEKISELVARDGLVKALKSGMPVLPPSLETKGEELEGW